MEGGDQFCARHGGVHVQGESNRPRPHPPPHPGRGQGFWGLARRVRGQEVGRGGGQGEITAKSCSAGGSS